jgi:hypothetical protein
VTPALLERPASLFSEGTAGGSSPVAAAERLGGGRMTLEERLNAVLHEARTNGSTECPVCQARMTRTRGGAAPDRIDCGGCGCQLT